MLKGKRTLILAALIAVGAVANEVVNVMEVSPEATYATLVMTGIMALMRVLTTTALFKGED